MKKNNNEVKFKNFSLLLLLSAIAYPIIPITPTLSVNDIDNGINKEEQFIDVNK